MKKAKRILSLVLAVMLVMSVFVLPAAADAPACPECGSYKYGYQYERLVEQSSYHVMDGSCPNDSYNHPHFINKVYHVYGCSDCGCTRSIYIGLRETCISD